MSEKNDYTGLTMFEFVNSILPNQSVDERARISKSIQRVLFSELRKRYRPVVERTYQTIGQMSQAYGFGLKSRASVIKEVKKQPVVGKFRSKKEIFEDHEFILIVHREDVYLLLDNSAQDAGIPQVQKYNFSEDIFIQQGASLLETLLTMKI